MIETNVRIISYGTGIYLDTRLAKIGLQDRSSELMNRVCGILRHQYRLAAIPYSLSGGPELLIASSRPIPFIEIERENWRAEVRDGGRSCRLQFRNPGEAPLMAQLMERILLTEIAGQTDMWTLVSSPRIWYEPRPFRLAHDISAYRRFRISVIPIDSVGIGVVTDVGTAFFTNRTIADYHLGDPSDRERFQFLSQRQRGQKGTLLYDLVGSKHTCYFEEFLPNETCDTIGPLVVRGRTYSSLFQYYEQQHPQAAVRSDSPVARVSFYQLGRQLVAADRLHLRVMNEALPPSLKQVDRIDPGERADLVRRFWHRLGERPLHKGMQSSLWHPQEANTALISVPSLCFGGNRALAAPGESNLRSYRGHYRERRNLLSEVGCLHVPPAVTSQIYFAFPGTGPGEMEETFAADVTERLSEWTRTDISYEMVSYSALEDAYSRRREASTDSYGNPRPSVAVFAFKDEDPATYFNLSYGLRGWRVKRVTSRQLSEHFSSRSRQWGSFVEMNALDVLQQLDCVPWSLEMPLNYAAQLVVDVGADRRYVALSLLICRDKQHRPAFWLDTIAWQKSDFKQETINKVILRDGIVNLFQRISLRRFDVLESMLVLRDGRKCGRELEGIREAQDELVSLDFLSRGASVAIVDLHKSSAKGIRVWEWNGSEAVNALEGTALFLDQGTVVLASTGSATLHQGTAQPLMLVANDDGVDMQRVASDVFAAAQLNWSNPRVAQRLPLPSKRTDDELRGRAAQQIKGLR